MRVDFRMVMDESWSTRIEEVLVCRSTGWFKHKIHQYQREEGYTTESAALVYIVKGRGEWAGKNDSGSLMAGDMLCLPPGIWAWHDPSPEEGWEEYWCTFSGNAWEDIVADLFLDGQPKVHHLGIDSMLIDSFERIHSSMQQRQHGWWLEASTRLYQLIMRSRLLKTSPHSNKGVDAAAQALLDLMSAAMTQADVDVHSVARSHEVHYDSLRRAFVELTGMSPKRYHTQLRIQAAADMILAHPDVSIAAVAQTYGWDDPAWFSRHFSKWKGCAPSVWRRTGKLLGGVGEAK